MIINTDKWDTGLKLALDARLKPEEKEKVWEFFDGTFTDLLDTVDSARFEISMFQHELKQLFREHK